MTEPIDMEASGDAFPLPNQMQKDPPPSADQQERPQRDAPVEEIAATSANGGTRAMYQNSGSGGDEEEGTSTARKRKNRRGYKAGKRHRSNWKPYSKMTWEERQACDERQSRRATQKRAEREARGQPMAPYNTTQFLMNEHPADDLQLSPLLAQAGSQMNCSADGEAELSGSMDSSDEFSSPEPDVEPDSFLEKEFADTYRSLHAERLQNLTKDELIREYLELEAKVERLESQVPNTTTGTAEEECPTSSESNIIIDTPSQGTQSVSNSHSNSVSQSVNGHASVEAELEKLRHECAQLRQEALDAEEAKLRAENRAQRLAGLKVAGGEM